MTTTRKLALNDILDLRAYERERADFRTHIIELKRKRRVQVGDIVTMLFESRDTIRFQIQEMARVEKLLRDEQIEGELATYNPLIPEPGELRVTMFVELVNENELRHWLPLLVGIERHIWIELADGTRVQANVDSDHESQLTRQDITSSVHYIGWDLHECSIDLAAQGMSIVIDHPNYSAAVKLSDATLSELLSDLRHDEG
jgi:Protein of unknown function (DUF3501)